MCNRYYLLLDKHLAAYGAMLAFCKSCFRARCGFSRICDFFMVTGERISFGQECITQQIYGVIRIDLSVTVYVCRLPDRISARQKCMTEEIYGVIRVNPAVAVHIAPCNSPFCAKHAYCRYGDNRQCNNRYKKNSY